MSIDNKETVLAALKARFAEDQGDVLEEIAREHGLTTYEVMACLPSECHALADGGAFEEVMTDVTRWGDVTLLIHTTDLILEYKGPVPAGRSAAGYYNLQGPPLSGHIRFENCASIHFLRRAFMKLDSAAIVFVNREDKPMFKIFVGRNSDRSLKKGTDRGVRTSSHQRQRVRKFAMTDRSIMRSAIFVVTLGLAVALWALAIAQWRVQGWAAATEKEKRLWTLALCPVPPIRRICRCPI